MVFPMPAQRASGARATCNFPGKKRSIPAPNNIWMQELSDEELQTAIAKEMEYYQLVHGQPHPMHHAKIKKAWGNICSDLYQLQTHDLVT